MNLIDGKKISNEIKKETAAEVELIKQSGGTPCLAVVIVGADPASLVYVKNKKKACEVTGIKSHSFELPAETTESQLLELIDELNTDKNVNGILVQMPLPKHIDETKVISRISPEKDVDGFHPANAGLLASGLDGMVACTPLGIIELLKRSGIEISGKNCVVIGRSNIVGKPVSMLLLKENGTVTICHSKTKDLQMITKQADILVAALGKPRFVTADMVKDGAVVIDVGIHRLGEKKICGDVDFGDVSEKCSHITPVPGGVGPMTIAVLMRNCVLAYKNQNMK